MRALEHVAEIVDEGGTGGNYWAWQCACGASDREYLKESYAVASHREHVLEFAVAGQLVAALSPVVPVGGEPQ